MRRSVYEKLEIVLLCIFIRSRSSDGRIRLTLAAYAHFPTYSVICANALQLQALRMAASTSNADWVNSNRKKMIYTSRNREKWSKQIFGQSLQRIDFFLLFFWCSVPALPSKQRATSVSSTDVRIKTGNEIDNSHTRSTAQRISFASLRFGRSQRRDVGRKQIQCGSDDSRIENEIYSTI